MGVDERSAAGAEALATALGSSVLEVALVPWGDSGATHRIDLADGRRVAARSIDTGRRDDAVRTARVMADAGRAGIPVPTPTVVDAAGATWFVTPWVDGELGARWLDTPERARILATAMGTLHRAIRADRPDAGAAGLRPRRLRADQRHPRGRWERRRPPRLRTR